MDRADSNPKKRKTSEDLAHLSDEAMAKLLRRRTLPNNAVERDTLVGQVEDDSDWEEQTNPHSSVTGSGSGITIELNPSLSQGSSKRKPIRRPSAQDKEVAELVHKVHLLCLLARGRLVDKACDDPLIQASVLSLLPAHLLDLSENRITAISLRPLISWFQNHFKVAKLSSPEKSFRLALARALQDKHGTPQEITALSVALFRALNLKARFVSLLDAVSLKPEVDKDDPTLQNTQKKGNGIFDNPIVMIDARNREPSTSPPQPTLCSDKSDHENDKRLESYNGTSGANASGRLKRRGDIEFELQMAMALSATACEVNEDAGPVMAADEASTASLKGGRTVIGLPSSQPVATAVGTKKVFCRSPRHWAEVFCSGENMVGKWVHVDAVNGHVDCEVRVEAAAAACRMPVRYVVAFAGYGAKDVTRRYCTKWYKVASQRVNGAWLDEVFAPLRELESQAAGDQIDLPFHIESSTRSAFVASRSILEDMELEMRELSEPLPTNQQAYRNHPRYALERWLTKYQIIHPKDPVLGFCSGYPVYRRSCVQMLKTKQKWLREGLQVKSNELPMKVLRRGDKGNKPLDHKNDGCEEASEETIELYGKWQLEPLCLPTAVNGIVPKNERGQVDVWSEKCLPHGTVHMRLPRIFGLAKKLEIDYAPAMVGFEFKNGRSVPVFDGIVVCSEFKDVLLEAYAEEQKRQEAEERKRNEREAMSHWYQLLSSIITRQKLNNCYGSGHPNSPGKMDTPNDRDVVLTKESSQRQVERMEIDQDVVCSVSGPQTEEEHEHVFLKENQSYDDETATLTKRCHCGFSIEVEEF